MSGIEHLHTRQPPIYHGDLKSVGSLVCSTAPAQLTFERQLNILIDSECCAILTDFGSARVLKGRTVGDSDDTRTIPESPAEPTLPGEDQASPQVTYCATAATLTLTGPHYTLRWAAPEVLLKSSFDLPSDIWAFGWICWEVSTVRSGKTPQNPSSRSLNLAAVETGYDWQRSVPSARDQVPRNDDDHRGHAPSDP